MKNIVKSGEEDADASSSFSRLPDELILQIINRLIDLKTLCFCYLVSKRFSSIVLQVDAVSFTAPLLNSPTSDDNTFGDVDGGGLPRKFFRLLINGVVFKPLSLLRRMIVTQSKPLPPIISSFYGQSFRSAVTFLSKFKGVKSLTVELPSSSHKGIDSSCLFKWKVRFGSRIESFFFLSPDSISETDEFHVNEIGDEEDINISNDLFRQKVHNAFQCLKDVILRHRMLLYIAKDLPMLEEVYITDSGRRGRLSISGAKLAEVKKEWVSSALETVKSEMNRIEIPSSVKHCYIPFLDMPISGYVMKGITLIVMDMNGFQGGIGNDGLMNSEDGLEDKEEAAYTEAVMEILENHKGGMKVLFVPGQNMKMDINLMIEMRERERERERDELSTMKGFGSCWTIRVPKADEPNNQSLAWKTKSVVKSPEEDADDTSPFSRLPDDIILQTLNKVIDLKSLCLCSLASKRFSLIVPRVGVVSFTAPLLKSPSSLQRLINGAVDLKCLKRFINSQNTNQISTNI
ncbi:hypothetical protein LXL04_023246 [Taraxacum kok-saghyz]